jgi:hypothetical protein
MVLSLAVFGQLEKLQSSFRKSVCSQPDLLQVAVGDDVRSFQQFVMSQAANRANVGDRVRARARRKAALVANEHARKSCAVRAFTPAKQLPDAVGEYLIDAPAELLKVVGSGGTGVRTKGE